MKENKKIFLGDLAILLFLVYVYLWRIGAGYSIRRITFSVYFLAIALIFYFFLFKFFKLNHWAILLGTIIFSFCGSDLSSVFHGNKIPYPGILPFFIACAYFYAAERKMRFLYLFVLITFFLALFSSIMGFAAILNSLLRLSFNFAAGIIVAEGFNLLLDPDPVARDNSGYRKIEKIFYNIWLWNLLFLIPIGYSLLILFIELSRKLIPDTVSFFVVSEIYLGWMLVILYKRHKLISEIIPFITIFLCAADIFTHWVVNIS